MIYTFINTYHIYIFFMLKKNVYMISIYKWIPKDSLLNMWARLFNKVKGIQRVTIKLTCFKKETIKLTCIEVKWHMQWHLIIISIDVHKAMLWADDSVALVTYNQNIIWHKQFTNMCFFCVVISSAVGVMFPIAEYKLIILLSL